MQLSNGLLFAVGATRSISCYSIRSFKKILEFKQITDINAYGPKGVRLFNTAINEKLIANVGFGKFKIFDTIRKKVLYQFDISMCTSKEIRADHGTSQPVVSNYCVIKSHFKVCYLLEEDDNIYFYNYRVHRLVQKIRLFDYKLNA